MRSDEISFGDSGIEDPTSAQLRDALKLQIKAVVTSQVIFDGLKNARS